MTVSYIYFYNVHLMVWLMRQFWGWKSHVSSLDKEYRYLFTINLWQQEQVSKQWSRKLKISCRTWQKLIIWSQVKKKKILKKAFFFPSTTSRAFIIYRTVIFLIRSTHCICSHWDLTKGPAGSPGTWKQQAMGSSSLSAFCQQLCDSSLSHLRRTGCSRKYDVSLDPLKHGQYSPP